MTADKFAFLENSLSLVAAARNLIRSWCEKQRIAWRDGTESSEERRDRLGAGVRAANAKIQPDRYFGRFDSPDDTDRIVRFFARQHD
jgi:hypothetical protein